MISISTCCLPSSTRHWVVAETRAGHAPRCAALVLAGLLPVLAAVAGETELSDEALDETFLSFLAEWDALVGDAEWMADGQVSRDSRPAEAPPRAGETDDDDSDCT